MNVLKEVLNRLNGESYQKHDFEKIFEVHCFEMQDDGKIKLILQPTDNPDYDPDYWEKVRAEQKKNEGAQNDNN